MISSRRPGATAGACLTLCCALAVRGQEISLPLSRDLPDYYVPGRTMTVAILAWEPLPRGQEKVPSGWAFLGPDSDFVAFDEATSTIHWEFPPPEVWLDVEFPPVFMPRFSYEVSPPLGQRGEVTFSGEAGFPFVCGGFGCPIGGDSVISDRPGSIRYRPQSASIQETIDSSDWGDTVMVSAGDTVFAEHITMKRGVNLVGYLDPGSSEPPRLRSNSWPLPAITAAPYCKISGFIIGWSACGIRVEDPTVEISNCVITGMQDAAIEYVGAAVGKVTNCTIVDNEGVGILCYEPSPSVVISNSILFGNGGKDFEKCTARFCLLEDEIEPGSGENNISADPMFVGPAEGDYRLLRGSPCIDAGDNSGIPAEAKDILGKPRILFGGKSECVDIGAYEYWFTSASRLPGSPDLQLRWSSAPDRTYSVFLSDDILTWQLADDSVPSAGATTLWTDPIGWPPPIPLRFYRVTENE
jgi:hypothetical protein